MKTFLRLSVVATAAGLLTFSAIPASAQFGVLGGIMGGTQSSTSAPSTVSASDLEKNLSSLNLRFGRAMQEMLRAQEITLLALGDKDKADQLSAEADALEGKDDINAVSRSISISQDASSECDSKMTSAGALDDHAKTILATAKPHYDEGKRQAFQLPIEYVRWVENAQATIHGMGANPIGIFSGGASLAHQLIDVTTVSSHIPALIDTWSATSDNFDKFTKTNKIDTGALAGKI
jgi:hypothetical protein